VVEPVAGRPAAAGDGVELPVATAALMPPMVAAAAMAIAVITIRGCRTVPRFYSLMKITDPRGAVRGVPLGRAYAAWEALEPTG
jgi:hypothetical protein